MNGHSTYCAGVVASQVLQWWRLVFWQKNICTTLVEALVPYNLVFSCYAVDVVVHKDNDLFNLLGHGLATISIYVFHGLMCRYIPRATPKALWMVDILKIMGLAEPTSSCPSATNIKCKCQFNSTYVYYHTSITADPSTWTKATGIGMILSTPKMIVALVMAWVWTIDHATVTSLKCILVETRSVCVLKAAK